MKDSENKKGDSLAMIFHSASYDKVGYGLIIAKAALSMGMEVNTLFTYGALNRLARNNTDTLGEETDSEILDVVEKGLTLGIIYPISHQIKDAKRLGLKIYACVTTMTLLDINQDELIEEVDKVTGIASFLDIASNATMSLYI
ncbi:MAG: DsrE/DsrF/DrsH-like family protein [Candidatus Thorarchaeota archaeon]